MRDADGRSGGGGADGSLERRIERLENDNRHIVEQIGEFRVEMHAEFGKMHGELVRMHGEFGKVLFEFGKLSKDVGELKGGLSKVPTTLQLVSLTIGTWIAGASVVGSLLRLLAD